MTAVRLHSRQWKIVAVAGMAIVVICLVVAFSRHKEAVQVWTASATYADLNQEVTTNGTVIPTSEFQARAFWPGIIEKVNVELGQRVRPGQLLVSMKDPFAISRLKIGRASCRERVEVSE